VRIAWLDGFQEQQDRVGFWIIDQHVGDRRR
jgi:hypothetical protein